MDKVSFFGPYEKYVIALLPVFGIALTSVNQIGRLAFYDVPFELMEFSAASTVLSAIALTITCAAGLLSIAIAYTRDIQTPLHRVLHHFLLAAMLTGPFWIRSVRVGASISWATVLFITALAGAGLMTESYYRSVRTGTDSTRHPQERLEKALHVALLIGFLVLVSAFTHGYNSAKESPTRLFVQGTNELVAGSFNGHLILKHYDPATKSINKNATVLLDPHGRLGLEKRSVRIEE